MAEHTRWDNFSWGDLIPGSKLDTIQQRSHHNQSCLDSRRLAKFGTKLRNLTFNIGIQLVSGIALLLDWRVGFVGSTIDPPT
jgi:hypothetical protein